MFDKESISLDGNWATGQILYHPLDLGEDNKQVEIVGWGGTYTNDFYWFWDGEKWVSMGLALQLLSLLRIAEQLGIRLSMDLDMAG